MPQNDKIAREQYIRYAYARDVGHLDYVRKANKCEDFINSKQWTEEDKAALAAGRRPALTINKVLITLASVWGEQIETRSEITFRPRTGAPTTNAEILTKVFRFVSDQNQLNWLRSEVFADGTVTSRGYYDVRLDFKDNVAGNIAITKLNPKNVLPDPDADSYDPETWGDVIVTSWMTADDIALYYNKADADVLRQRSESAWIYGFDSIDDGLDRFGGNSTIIANLSTDLRAQSRNIRVIERQHRVLVKRKYFVNPKTGAKLPIPDEYTKEQINEIATAGGLLVTEDLGKRIRWTVTADDFVLFDEWSPYNHFTVVPYFPIFRYGRTIGLVENLIDPQELLNKTLSQELHVVNTMANSGWKVRTGVLQNLSLEELEEVGAKSGLVLEVSGDPDKDVVKIQPNQIPQGLDRISFKAEGFIKSISGRGDSVMGLDRADVSAKAIGEKKESSDATLRKALDNLERTDWLLARNILDIIQHYYTDPRILNITKDDLTGEMETVDVNMPDANTGEILNDLSLGAYDIVVVSQAAKRTLEESQFEQAIGMRELGVKLPDKYLILNSNLVDKAKIVQEMEKAAQSPEAQLQAKAELLAAQLQVANLRAQTASEEAEALHKRAKTAQTIADTAVAAKEAAGSDNEMEIEAAKAEQEMQIEREKHAMKMEQMKEEHALKMQLKQAEMVEQIKLKRAQTILTLKQQAQMGSANGGKAPQAGGGQQKPAAQ